MKKIYLTLSLVIMMFVPSITFGNVIDKLNEAGKFNKLNETLAKSGLNENLKGAGPFTVLHH
jgi:hypothetical protein